MKKLILFIVCAAVIAFIFLYATNEELNGVFAQPCSEPVTYSITNLSPAYDLEETELKAILAEIDQAWSEAAGKNLFTYNIDGDLSVNVIYDEQQRFLDKADAISNRIEYQKKSYRAAEQRLEQLKRIYEEREQQYNERVSEFNELQSGSATSEREQRQLAREIEQERVQLNNLADRLNERVGTLNQISKTINGLIAEYNAKYGISGEFNQGDYQKDAAGERINIYGFRTMEELRMVLAHEMGHALGLDHVENPESIMYYLMKDQPMGKLAFTRQDIEALNELCGS